MGVYGNGNEKTARKQKVRPTSKGGDFSIVFINFELTEAAKRHLAQCVEAGEISADALFELTASGYKVSLKEDKERSRFTTSIIDNDPDSAFFNHSISGSGSTQLKSVYSLLYKHLVVAQGDWNTLRSDGDSEYA